MDAPDVVIVIKIPGDTPVPVKKATMHSVMDFHRIYGSSVLFILAPPDFDIQTFGCEKIEVKNLSELAEKLVDSAMTQEERQKIYEKLHALGCRIY